MGDFKVNLQDIARKKRKSGISGIMRVKNDAEFIEPSVESCIDALDELIIVYNGCTDNSPEIIKRLAAKYPQKIKAFEYTPLIYSVGLTESEYEHAKSLPKDSVHLLANYCNFALSKASYKYVTKIDADQIYFSSDFRDICNAYRGICNYKLNIYYVFSFLIIFAAFIWLKLRPQSKLSLNYHQHFQGYRKVLLRLIKTFKIPISLSGINLFYQNGWYVTLGKISESLNILIPYNGVGDTIIFKVSSKTRFVPIEMEAYNKLTGTKYSIIERLVGLKPALSYGFTWFHLNAMRRNYYSKQLHNFEIFNEAFISLAEFIKTDFSIIRKHIPDNLFSYRLNNLFSILHSGNTSLIPIHEIEDFYYTPENGLKKE